MGGFVNSLHLEHPKLLCKTLEVRQQGAGGEQILDAISAEFQARIQDATSVRYQAQERRSGNSKPSTSKNPPARPFSGHLLKEKGVYLITGGAGGLGLIFAEFLAKECKARLVLTGRSTLPAEREARLEELRKSGAEVLYLPADVSCYSDVENLVRETKSRFGAVHGIIHAAGVIRDSLVRNKTQEELSAVLAPKVYGTLHLDDVTRNERTRLLRNIFLAGRRRR